MSQLSPVRHTMATRLVALILAVTVAPSPFQAQAEQCPAGRAVNIQNGFATGLECRQFTEQQAASYMMGFVNGAFVSPMWGASESCVRELGECLKGKTGRGAECGGIGDKCTRFSCDRASASLGFALCSISRPPHSFIASATGPYEVNIALTSGEHSPRA